MPLLGAMVGCHCRAPLLGAMAQCHGRAPLLGAMAGCYTVITLKQENLVQAIWGLCWNNFKKGL